MKSDGDGSPTTVIGDGDGGGDGNEGVGSGVGDGSGDGDGDGDGRGDGERGGAGPVRAASIGAMEVRSPLRVTVEIAIQEPE